MNEVVSRPAVLPASSWQKLASPLSSGKEGGLIDVQASGEVANCKVGADPDR